MNKSKLIRIDSRLNQNAELPRSPTVCVLMSTYNGEKHIDEQIKSIDLQIGVKTDINIRDDGSSDDTNKIISSWISKTENKITVEFGDNLGYVKSFGKLLLDAEGHDYYAFSDQDDVWERDKLIKAITVLCSENDKPAVYASSVRIVNESLVPICTNTYPNLIYSISSEFIRHRIAGHTMVWNEALQREIRKIGWLPAWSHDQYVILAGLLSSATLFLDEASYVRHRRLDKSITPGGGSLKKRISHELKLILNNGLCDRKALANRLLTDYSKCLNQSDYDFLTSIQKSENSLIERIKFVMSPRIDCGLIIGDIEARVSILIGRFCGGRA